MISLAQRDTKRISSPAPVSPASRTERHSPLGLGWSLKALAATLRDGPWSRISTCPRGILCTTGAHPGERTWTNASTEPPSQAIERLKIHRLPDWRLEMRATILFNGHGSQTIRALAPSRSQSPGATGQGIAWEREH